MNENKARSRLDQRRAPIYEALERFRQMRVVPFDVPGHKRGRGNPELTAFLGQQCVGVALAENAVLRREAAALREQLAKERQRETRREERAARAAAETAQEQSAAPETPAADSAQADETN